MEPDNIEERVTSLESQVGDLTQRVRASEQDAMAARVLAGTADRDVADFEGELRDLRGELHDFRRATMSSFNALRADMSDRFTQVGRGFGEMRAKFDAAAAGQQQIVGLIQGLIAERGENWPTGLSQL